MPGLANLVRVVSATSGTGTLTLGAAVTGFLTPTQAGMSDGQVYSYAIEAAYVTVGDDLVPTAREVGTGTYTASGTTLTRSVINSTNSNSLLNLTGDQQVIISFIATSSGDVSILGTTASTSSTTGALTVAGGVGIGAKLYVASQINAGTGGAEGEPFNAIGNGAAFCHIDSDTSATIRGQFYASNAVTAAGFMTATNHEMRLGTNNVNNRFTILGDGTTTIRADVATPASGSTSARLLFGTTADFGIYYGSGVPTVSAAAGSLYIRTDNAGASLRLYSNTTGSTTWAAITSA